MVHQQRYLRCVWLGVSSSAVHITESRKQRDVVSILNQSLPLCVTFSANEHLQSASIAASVGGDTTIVQFKKWNTYILGLCDNLTEGQWVCIR